MSQASKSMFTDRRDIRERRQQDLPMPAELDRRQGLRREQGFKSKPWWLQVDYATELISAKEVAKAVEEIRQPASPGAQNNDDKTTEG